MAVRLSAIRAGRPLSPGRFLIFISVRNWVDPQGHSAAGRIRSIEKSSDLIGEWNPRLLACSVVPQPTTQTGAPNVRTYITDQTIKKSGFCSRQGQISFSSQCAGRLWGPLSLLSNGYGGLFLVGKSTGMWRPFFMSWSLIKHNKNWPFRGK
jgi:hypothetical protein